MADVTVYVTDISLWSQYSGNTSIILNTAKTKEAITKFSWSKHVTQSVKSTSLGRTLTTETVNMIASTKSLKLFHPQETEVL